MLLVLIDSSLLGMPGPVRCGYPLSCVCFHDETTEET